MPVTLLDIILIGVMLISALLAFGRGFMRTSVGIACLILALTATLTLVPLLSNFHFYDESALSKTVTLRTAVEMAIFFGTLILAVIFTGRTSHRIMRSHIGGLDRTIGFGFGLTRGLIIVAVPFLFFSWLVSDSRQPEWIRSARSRVVLETIGDWLMSVIPDDADILEKLKGKSTTEALGHRDFKMISLFLFSVVLPAIVVSPVFDIAAIIVRLARPERKTVGP